MPNGEPPEWLAKQGSVTLDLPPIKYESECVPHIGSGSCTCGPEAWVPCPSCTREGMPMNRLAQVW